MGTGMFPALQAAFTVDHAVRYVYQEKLDNFLLS